MTGKEADEKIREEWRAWAKQNNIVDAGWGDAMAFYQYVRQTREHLLDFRYDGDKWQFVHTCLLHAGYVTSKPKLR